MKMQQLGNSGYNRVCSLLTSHAHMLFYCQTIIKNGSLFENKIHLKQVKGIPVSLYIIDLSKLHLKQ